MRIETLLLTAAASRSRAYAPYSGFPVGAALLTEEGAVFTGANIENASFGLTVCAERVAIWSAVHAGYRKFSHIAVLGDCSPPPTPCGACRQVLWELAGDIGVVMGNLNGEVVRRPLSALIPEPFSGEGWSTTTGGGGSEGREDHWRLPLTFNPVGYVRNQFNEPADIPAGYKQLLSEIVIETDLEEGLFRLEEEKKIIVIGYLHRVRGYILKEERSGRGGEIYGVFACRAPRRPNGIALSEVELVERQGTVLTVKGLDLLNGTPVLDIKTVIPPGEPGVDR